MLKLGRAEVRIGGPEKLGSRARAGSAEARRLEDAISHHFLRSEAHALNKQYYKDRKKGCAYDP